MLYDTMAEYYHLIFENWDLSLSRQGSIIAALLPSPDQVGPVLDCACGIGTQSLALSSKGYDVTGSDISSREVDRARREAFKRGLSIPFRCDDMRSLASSPENHFGCVVAFDNSLPHLDSDAEVLNALSAMHSRLRDGGTMLLSIRDYENVLDSRPRAIEPTIIDDNGRRRIVHQIWDWKDDRRYTVHIFITQQLENDDWANHHFVGHYRAITPAEVAAFARQTGFEKIEVLRPAATGFYQPIIRAVKQ